MGIIKYINQEESEIFIFDEFIINQIREGIVIEPKHNDVLNEIIQKYFSGKNMVYISNRMRSYSVNPLIYNETTKIPNLLAIALIPKTPTMRISAKYEREFYGKPYEIFDSLTAAIGWAHTILEKAEDRIESDK